MKVKWNQILISMGISCLILGMFVGCGQEQKLRKGNETQGTMDESKTVDESKADESRTTVIEYWTGETSAVVYFDDDSEKSQSQKELIGNEQKEEEEVIQKQEVVQEQEVSRLLEENMTQEESMYEESKALQPYYLSMEDQNQVIRALIEMGERYGLTYYPDISEGETWDSPTPIYAEELLRGRDYIMTVMMEYTEGAFALMQMEGCSGFALQIKEFPNTVTEAYYEVYVYWV